MSFVHLADPKPYPPPKKITTTKVKITLFAHTVRRYDMPQFVYDRDFHIGLHELASVQIRFPSRVKPPDKLKKQQHSTQIVRFYAISIIDPLPISSA